MKLAPVILTFIFVADVEVLHGFCSVLVTRYFSIICCFSQEISNFHLASSTFVARIKLQVSRQLWTVLSPGVN